MDIPVKTIETRDYVSKSNLPTADYVINPYVGCPHACKYCYASFMKRFTGHTEEWGSFADVKICRTPINTKKLIGKSVFLSSVTDCYNRLEAEYRVTRRILEQLADVDCRLGISTKSPLILRDLDILKRCKHLKVSISLNTLDDGFRSDMDKAGSVTERLHTLRTLHENGIYAILFMSPLFPHLSDFKSIVEAASGFTDEFWFENLNLRGSYKKTILEYIQTRYPQWYDTYRNIYVLGNKEYWVSLSKEIDAYCTERGVPYTNYFYHEKLVQAKLQSGILIP